ncbi:MAG: hypothetical protein JJU05_07635 [Verrucomicrobia bacterium]|nr:hypothetical protein [Verrucomicrobiota bacterium]MCH8528737.1 hypothetical protein [Kiritimatiellia bacterium]
MSAFRTVRPRAWGALALAVIFLLLGFSGHGLRRDRERLARLMAQERGLRAMVEDVETEREWLLRQLPRGLDEPQVLIDTYASGTRITVRDPEAEVLSEAFQLWRVTLELDGVPWESVHGVIEAFETQSPPWRLLAFDLRSGLTGLEGQLRFEGLERLE